MRFLNTVILAATSAALWLSACGGGEGGGHATIVPTSGGSGSATSSSTGGAGGGALFSAGGNGGAGGGAGGSAAPPIGTAFCGGVDVDTTTDPENCGACGTVCPGGVCISSRCVSPPTTWAEILAAGSLQTAWAVAADASGDIFVVGQFFGTFVAPGGVSVTDPGDGNAFVVKLDSTGKVLWLDSFGDLGEQSATAVVVNAAGQAVVGLSSATAITVGTTPVAAGLSVVTLDGTDGSVVWATGIDGGGTGCSAAIDCLALTPTGDIALAGYACSSVDFGDGPEPGGAWPGGSMVALLRGTDGSGKASDGYWGHAFGDYAACVAVDSAGDVVAAGIFAGPLGLGSLVAPMGSKNSPNRALYIAQFLADGSLKTVQQYGDVDGSGFVLGFVEIAADDAGGIFVTGLFTDSINFGATSATNVVLPTGYGATFLVKLDTSLDYQWMRTFHGVVTSLALAPSGDIAFAAECGGPDDFGTGPIGTGMIGSESTNDICLVELDATGQTRRAYAFDAYLGTDYEVVTVLPDGDVILAGDSQMPVNLCTGVLAAGGVFVADLGP